MGLKSLLIRLAPRFLVGWFARPYIAGLTVEDALKVAGQLRAGRGLHASVNLLGEEVHDEEQVEQALEAHLGLVRSVGNTPDCYVSVKPTVFGIHFDPELFDRSMRVLLEEAAAHNRFVRIEMEDHTTTDATLEGYRRLHGDFGDKVGLVLQSRLHRTEADIRALAPLKPNARLCIGIYTEPEAIALTRKPAMKARLVEQLELMLQSGYYVGVATHDEATVAQCVEVIDRLGTPPDQYEFQMLLGVPRRQLQDTLVAEGRTMRMYLPYGDDWYAYCTRRLINNPRMALLVLRNLFRRR